MELIDVESELDRKLFWGSHGSENCRIEQLLWQQEEQINRMVISFKEWDSCVQRIMSWTRRSDEPARLKKSGMYHQKWRDFESIWQSAPGIMTFMMPVWWTAMRRRGQSAEFPQKNWQRRYRLCHDCILRRHSALYGWHECTCFKTGWDEVLKDDRSIKSGAKYQPYCTVTNESNRR